MKRLLIVIAIVALLMTCLAAVPALGADRGTSTAREQLARFLGLPATSVVVDAEVTVRFPVSGVTARVYKVRGQAGSIAVTASGSAMSADVLVAAEDAAYQRRYGKLEPQLHAAAAQASAGEALDVLISLRATAVAPVQSSARATGRAATDRGLSDAEETTLAAADATTAAAANAAARPVEATLRRMGVPYSRGAGSQLLSARMTSAQIAELAQLRDVDRIESAPVTQPMSEIVYTTAGFNTVVGRGFNGSGVKLGQVEVGGYVNPANPWLKSFAFSDANASLCSVSVAPSHSAVVAGIMRSHSPGATLLATGDCNGRLDYLFDRARAAVTWGAKAVNHSWGETCLKKDGTPTGAVDGRHTAADKAMDTLVYTNRRLQIVAAGNDGATCQYVAEPGSAWNALTVGNSDDRNTNSWTDDLMSSSSSWRDPSSLHGDMDKPEVAAPGTAINSALNAYPWWGGGTSAQSGTSYAAPVYTALAGDLIQRAPALATRPEVLKAVMMTSSIHNVEGFARLSEYDGVGGPWAPYADDVAKGIVAPGTLFMKSGWAWQPFPCSTSPTNTNYYAYFVAGKRVRITIAWSTNPNYVSYASQPSADLDLRVYNYATGAMVKSSSSWDNAWEIVDFTPAASGYYTIETRKDRCSASPAGLGVAWWQMP